MWYQSECCNVEKPLEIEVTKTTIFVRKDFVHHEATEDKPASWTYLERKMTPSEYELYQDNQALKDYLDMIS